MKDLGLDPAAVEAAVLQALQPLLSERWLRTLEAYSGQLQVEDIKELTGLFPVAYVIWEGADLQQLGRADGLQTLFSVVIGSRNLRGGQAALQGDGTTRGVYELLNRARALLHGKVLVQGWYQARLLRESPLAYDPRASLAVYSATYEIRKQT